MEILDWVIWVDSYNDRLIEWWDIPVLRKQDLKQYEYNQYNQYRSKMSCTIFSSAWSLADTVNEGYSIDRLRYLNDMSYKQWRSIGKGRRLFEAVDLTRDERNDRNPSNKVVSYKLDVTSSDFFRAINLWYSCSTVYYGNSKYNKDKNDWHLEWVKFWKSTYWHAIRLWANNGSLYVIDNNLGNVNRYSINDHKELVKNWVFSKYAYMYVKVNDTGKNTEQLKKEAILKLLKNQLKASSGKLMGLDNWDGILDTMEELENKIQLYLE